MSRTTGVPHRRDTAAGSTSAKRARHAYGQQPYHHQSDPTAHRRQQRSYPHNHNCPTAHVYAHKARQTSTSHKAVNQHQYHYYSNGKWQHPSSVRESTYSDFVPCSYDHQTLFTRLYKYALTFLAQANSNSKFSPRTLFGKNRPGLDIEMITSSPSPTLHASSPSPRTAFSRPGHGSSYRYPNASSSHPNTKPPSPPAFPKPALRVPHNSSKLMKKRSLPASLKSSGSSWGQLVDSGTQYSPPLVPTSSSGSDHSKARGKRKERSISPPSTVPPLPTEPELPAQMSTKRTTPPIPASTHLSSVTLNNSSSGNSSSSQGSSPKRARPPKAAAKVMPTKYETCDVKDLVLLISNMLMELIRFNDRIPLKDGRLTRFHSRAPPGISVIDYLQRLTTHATLSPPILLSMVYYIDRLCALYPAFTISSLTVHRFLITAATVASKGLSDSFWTNNTYARVGGVSLKELALLELEFLWRVEWRIVPKPEVLEDYYRSLVERSEGFDIEIVEGAEEAESMRGVKMGKDKESKRDRSGSGSRGRSGNGSSSGSGSGRAAKS